MATDSRWASPVASGLAIVAYGLASLGAVATVWLVTFVAAWSAVGAEIGLLGATALAIVPLLALCYVGVAAEGGPTLSMAAYVGVFAAATVGVLVAVWTTVIVVLALPLGLDLAATVAGWIALALIVALTGGAVAAIAALGRAANWGLVLRMAVAMLLLVLVTIGFLAAVWTVVYLAAVFAVGPLLGIYAAGAVTLGVIGWIGYREYTQVGSIERRLEATPTTPDDLPGIHATTTKLATQLGVPKPEIAVSETHAPEALIVGFRPSNTHLVLSYGAVTALDEAELEAVIAHELAHVANRDAMVMTALSTPAVLSEGLRARLRDDPEPDPNEAEAGAAADEWAPPEGRPDPDGEWGEEEIFGPNEEWKTATHPPDDDDEDDTDNDGLLFKIVFGTIATVTWLVSRAIVAVLSRARETAADRTAAEVTGSPAAVAGALRTLDDRIEATPNRDLRDVASVSSLSILPLEPMEVDVDDDGTRGSIRASIARLRVRLFRTHPPTERRLALLEDLERERYESD